MKTNREKTLRRVERWVHRHIIRPQRVTERELIPVPVRRKSADKREQRESLQR